MLSHNISLWTVFTAAYSMIHMKLCVFDVSVRYFSALKLLAACMIQCHGFSLLLLRNLLFDQVVFPYVCIVLFSGVLIKDDGDKSLAVDACISQD